MKISLFIVPMIGKRADGLCPFDHFFLSFFHLCEHTLWRDMGERRRGRFFRSGNPQKRPITVLTSVASKCPGLCSTRIYTIHVNAVFVDLLHQVKAHEWAILATQAKIVAKRASISCSWALIGTMAALGSFSDDPLPTTEQVVEVRAWKKEFRCWLNAHRIGCLIQGILTVYVHWTCVEWRWPSF